ncbi:MAG: single-stranded DNA-binding protein [Helicobacteraceae bacterium]|nr:single-stranded DNA-binding protein [Helicobacteraceae bacterium]
MLNKVLLIGNLTRDVEMRYAQTGTAIGKFGLAVNRRWKDRNTGDDRDETMFIDVNAFGRSAEIAHQYLSKGRQVLVEGRLVLEQWTDQNGQKRSRHTISAENIQFLGSKPSEGGDQSQSGYYGGDDFQAPPPPPRQSAPQQSVPPRETSAYNQPPAAATPRVEIEDEEIPF